MKQIILIALLNSILFCSFSQEKFTEKWPQFQTDTISSERKTNNLDISAAERFSTYNLGNNNITNVEVSRNPAEVLITNDDQFAFVRCFRGNSVEIIEINTGDVVKAFSIPCPKDFLISKNGALMYVASFRDEPAPANLPPDECSPSIIPLSGKSLLTTIDIQAQEIIKIDTIKTLVIKRILRSSVDSIIFLQGKEVIEYDLSNSTILKQWSFPEQIWHSDIDNKNKRIFLTTIDSSAIAQLKVIDLITGVILTKQYYTNGEVSGAHYIGMDTLSNRVFVQGKYQPTSEVLVFNAISLNQLPPISDASLVKDSFLACPTLGSIFIGGAYPTNTLELDYSTLQLKQTLPFPLYTSYHTLHLNKDKSRLYTYQYGSSEDGLSFISPSQYLDLVEYDIETGKFWQYNTTELQYECSYGRSLAIADNDQYLIATNSPENTVSIIEIPYSAVNENTSNNSISIFPNPTTDKLNINFKKQIFKNYTIEIFDFIGRMVFKTSVFNSGKNYTIDITKYPKGQYYLHIKTIDQSSFFKVIKI